MKDAECLAAAFHPTGRHVATGGADGKIIIWIYPTASPMLELPFSRTVAALRFSADGSRLTAIDREGKVGIWDRNGGSRMGCKGMRVCFSE